MFKYHEIKVLHIEPTTRCQASCPMCARNIKGGITHPSLKINDITLDNIKTWLDIDFVKQLEKIYVCGNFGDPAINLDLLDIFKYLKDCNPSLVLSMNTNGSLRNKNFWEELASIGVIVHFGIDGIDQEAHSRYRIGTNIETIFNNAKAFIEKGGYAIWDMLIFKHNEHQVEQARKLSQDLGFKIFVSKSTSRFKDESYEVLDKSNNVIDTLFPSTLYPPEIQIDQSNIWYSTLPITCKVKKEKSIYISASGHVFPCCWTGQYFYERNVEFYTNPQRKGELENYIKFIDLIGIDSFDLHKNRLPNIINNVWKEYETNWTLSDKLIVCARICGGGRDIFSAQFKNVQEFNK